MCVLIHSYLIENFMKRTENIMIMYYVLLLL